MASSQLHAPWDDGGDMSGHHETQHDDSDSFDSEDYDEDDPDYSDYEHNNSEESSEYDFCNNNFEDDSEYDLGYNYSENGSEYSHENDDEELIPRMQDIPDHGISSDVEDLVFEEEEEEGIHDELEAEEYNDGSDTNALQPQMHNPFRPAYSFSNLQHEPKSIRVDRFGRRFESAVRFLVRKAQETDWAQRNTQEAWVHIGFKHPVGKSSPDMIMEIFRNVIPESTMAILGHTHVTYEHIMTLPTVDFSSNLPGVYLIAFAPSIHQQHQVQYGRFGNFTTPIGQQPQVPDTCYAGSSTVDVSMRCHDHMQHFHDIDAAELHRRQSQPNRKSTLYLYKVAGTFGLVPTYLEIARFPEHLEEIGISGADANWLIRLLEQAMILLLDIYAPSEHKGARQLFGYTKEMYLEALAECEIPESTFHPLNHAMPLKQRSGWTVGPRVCRNCGNHTTANAWYYDHADCELALFYICSSCYWYHRRRGVTRPSTLFNSFRARPSSGPCSNCNTTETSLWSWHPNNRTSVVCGACLIHWNRYRVDRPPKKEEKHCTECGATDPIGHWHCVYDANREKTGASLCSSCAMQQQRDYNKEAKANNYAGCICSICHGTNLPAWKTARTCLSCWENNRSVLALKRERDRSDCWHCHCPFQKQKFKATSNKAWRSERYWHAVLEEWICKRCSVHVKDHGSFGFTASDLEKFEIRCEDCHTLYAWRWCTLGQKSLDRIQDSNITWDRIMCGNCYQERNNNYFVNQQPGVYKELTFPDRREDTRANKEQTWQEKKCLSGAERFEHNKLLISYLLRVHGKDFTMDAIVANKLRMESMSDEDSMDID